MLTRVRTDNGVDLVYDAAGSGVTMPHQSDIQASAAGSRFGVPDGTILYDGVCVLCSAWFHFVAARDRAARFRFVAIQSRRGRALADRLGIDPDAPQSNAVILDGRAHLRSESALQVVRTLPGWGWVGALRLLPRAPRDWLYDRIARNRYRLFGRTQTCMVPGPELRRHLLPDDAE